MDDSKYLMGDKHRNRTRLFTEMPGDRTSCNRHKLEQGEFLLDTWKNFTPVRVAEYLKGCRISFFADFRTGMDEVWSKLRCSEVLAM